MTTSAAVDPASDVRVLVVGAGISGLAAAAQLAAASIAVHVVDMGENPGGRLAVRDLSETGTAWDGHVVDVGAAYFTLRDSEFEHQVGAWCEEGLVRPWCDTATVVDGNDRHRHSGPMRYAAQQGLRSLARAMMAELAQQPGVTIELSTTAVSVEPYEGRLSVMLRRRMQRDSQNSYGAVVLACPDPQAARVIPAKEFEGLRATLSEIAWLPVITHTMVFPERIWPDDDLWFVNDSAVLATLADDGRRRGDGAAVLVAHSTCGHAVPHLDNPPAAAPALEAEVARVLGVAVHPVHRITKRWGLARPQQGREEMCGWDARTRVAVCGDGWAGRSRIEAAWLSGRAAARQVLAALER